MARNRRNWGGWLLVMLSALFAVTYLWRYSEESSYAKVDTGWLAALALELDGGTVA